MPKTVARKTASEPAEPRHARKRPRTSKKLTVEFGSFGTFHGELVGETKDGDVNLIWVR